MEAARVAGAWAVAATLGACTFSAPGGGDGGGSGGEDSSGAAAPMTGIGPDTSGDDDGGEGIPNPTSIGEESSAGEEDTSDTGETCSPPAAPGCPCTSADDCVLGTQCIDDICLPPTCGDGIVDRGEECDDGNDIDDDGCDSCAQSSMTAQVVAGSAHTCARFHTGEVKCWGEGDQGRTGYGSKADIGVMDTPADHGYVEIDTTQPAIDICAGDHHTCAVMEDGDVHCWGDHGQGRLGANSNVDIGADDPPSSFDPVVLGHAALAITCGTAHTCALVEGGDVLCWGDDGDGRLGNQVGEPIGDDENPQDSPLVVLDGEVVQIEAGDKHTCALLSTGIVRCWGLGTLGRLGNGDQGNLGTIGDDEDPTVDGNVVAMPDDTPAVAITVGLTHACALLDNATVMCWGDNSDGQLGYGDPEDVGDDETLSGHQPVNLGHAAVAVEAGGRHTCAVLDDDTVKCWGHGMEGQLGYGNNGSLDAPPMLTVDLGMGTVALALAGGAMHTCARVAGGELFCWGAAGSGRLGYGPTFPGTVGDDEDPVTAGYVPL